MMGAAVARGKSFASSQMELLSQLLCFGQQLVTQCQRAIEGPHYGFSLQKVLGRGGEALEIIAAFVFVPSLLVEGRPE